LYFAGSLKQVDVRVELYDNVSLIIADQHGHRTIIKETLTFNITQTRPLHMSL